MSLKTFVFFFRPFDDLIIPNTPLLLSLLSSRGDFGTFGLPSPF